MPISFLLFTGPSTIKLMNGMTRSEHLLRAKQNSLWRKHRNGGLDSIRLKFIGNLGKFDNLDDFDSPFEFQSKMNANEENPFITKNLPNANDAFGSSMNDDTGLEEDNDIPF